MLAVGNGDKRTPANACSGPVAHDPVARSRSVSRLRLGALLLGLLSDGLPAEADLLGESDHCRSNRAVDVSFTSPARRPERASAHADELIALLPLLRRQRLV